MRGEGREGGGREGTVSHTEKILLPWFVGWVPSPVRDTRLHWPTKLNWMLYSQVLV